MGKDGINQTESNSQVNLSSYDQCIHPDSRDLNVFIKPDRSFNVENTSYKIAQNLSNIIPSLPLRIPGKFQSPYTTENSGIVAEFIDDFNMTSNPIWGPQTPGQISGIIFDQSTNTYLAISDDALQNKESSRGYPRMYKLKIDIKQNENGYSVELKNEYEAITLKDPNGDPFFFEFFDPEGITILPNKNIVIASEGYARIKSEIDGRTIKPQGPRLYEFTPAGNLIRTLNVPSYYDPSFKNGEQIQGARANKGFESLTVSPCGNYLFTATENALVQDGAISDSNHGAFARILQYTNLDGSYKPTNEFVYPVDAIPNPWNAKVTGGDNGVVEMLAIDSENLLVLERAFVKGPYKNHIRLYNVDVSSATNTLGMCKLEPHRVVPVSKELAFDFENAIPSLEDTEPNQSGSGKLENYEAMTLTNLPDGTTGLLFMDDNNHNPKHQRQSIIVMRENPEISKRRLESAMNPKINNAIEAEKWFEENIYGRNSFGFKNISVEALRNFPIKAFEMVSEKTREKILTYLSLGIKDYKNSSSLFAEWVFGYEIALESAKLFSNPRMARHTLHKYRKQIVKTLIEDYSKQILWNNNQENAARSLNLLKCFAKVEKSLLEDFAKSEIKISYYNNTAIQFERKSDDFTYLKLVIGDSKIGSLRQPSIEELKLRNETLNKQIKSII